MKPDFYPFAIFFTVLLFMTSVFQSLIYFQVGGRLYTLQSAPAWYVFGSVVYAVAACFLLKYFQFRQYRFTFIAFLIATITFFWPRSVRPVSALEAYRSILVSTP